MQGCPANRAEPKPCWRPVAREVEAKCCVAQAAGRTAGCIAGCSASGPEPCHDGTTQLQAVNPPSCHLVSLPERKVLRACTQSCYCRDLFISLFIFHQTTPTSGLLNAHGSSVTTLLEPAVHPHLGEAQTQPRICMTSRNSIALTFQGVKRHHSVWPLCGSFRQPSCLVCITPTNYTVWAQDSRAHLSAVSYRSLS